MNAPAVAEQPVPTTPSPEEALLRRRLNRAPGDVAVRLRLSGLLTARGLAHEGLGLMHQALRFNPGDERLLRAKAELLMACGLTEPAVETLRHMVTLLPNDAAARAALGAALAAIGRHDAALGAFDEALKAHPGRGIGGTGEVSP